MRVHVGISAAVPRQSHATSGATSGGAAAARLIATVDHLEYAAASLHTLADTVAEDEQQKLEGERRRLENEKRRHEAKVRAQLDASFDRAHLDIEDHLRHDVGYAYESWDAETWTTGYDHPTQLAHLVRVATLRFASPNGIVDLPLTLPALGSSLIVTHDAAAQADANAIAQGYVTRILAASRPRSVQVHLIDPTGFGQNLGVLSQLPPPLASGGIRTTHAEMRTELADVRAHVDLLTTQLLTSADDSLVRGWNTQTAGTIPCSVVCIAGLAPEFDDQDAAELSAIISAGRRCGVSIVAVVEGGRQLGHEITLDHPAEHIHLDADGSGSWVSAPRGVGELSTVLPPTPPQHNQHIFLTMLAEAAYPDAGRIEPSGHPDQEEEHG